MSCLKKKIEYNGDWLIWRAIQVNILRIIIFSAWGILSIYWKTFLATFSHYDFFPQLWALVAVLEKLKIPSKLLIHSYHKLAPRRYIQGLGLNTVDIIRLGKKTALKKNLELAAEILKSVLFVFISVSIKSTILSHAYALWFKLPTCNPDLKMTASKTGWIIQAELVLMMKYNKLLHNFSIC